MSGAILEQGTAPYGVTAITGPGGQRGLSVPEEEARDPEQRVAEVASRLHADRSLDYAPGCGGCHAGAALPLFGMTSQIAQLLIPT
jgi:hypothetical protein